MGKEPEKEKLYICVYMCVCVYIYKKLNQDVEDIESSSLCYTVGPCHLSILYTLICIC